MIDRWLLAVPLFFAAVSAVDDVVDVRELGEGRVEATLTSAQSYGEGAAQAILLPHISRLCGDAPVALGRYRFEGTQPVLSTDTSVASSFRFVQQATCGKGSPPADDHEVAGTVGVAREDTAQDLEHFISEVSVRFLTDRASGEFERAFASLSQQMRSYSTFADWSAQARQFNADAGALVAVDVWRITVYDNPPGSPRAGLYVAADFEIESEQLPLQCGYLIWYALPDGRFAITREERAVLPPDFLASISPGRLPQLMAQMGCMRQLQGAGR